MSKGYCDYCRKLKVVKIDKILQKDPQTKSILFICKDCKAGRSNERKPNNTNPG